MVLTILTPTIRLDGALEAVRSVQAAHAHPWEIRHVLAYWPSAPVSDHTLLAPWLTSLIASIPGGWLFAVDDDNRMHPELPARLGWLVQEYPDARAFVFDQAYPQKADGVLRARPQHMHPGSVDGGQVALQATFAQSLPWPARECGDGEYLSALYRQASHAFVFVNEVLTYHNHQVWGDNAAS